MKTLKEITSYYTGPDNKATGSGKNSLTPEILKELKGDLSNAPVNNYVMRREDDSENVGNPEGTGPKPMHSGPAIDLMKDIKEIQKKIKEDMPYPKYGDDDAKFLEGKDEGEFGPYEGNPPSRLKTTRLTTGKEYYQGDK